MSKERPTILFPEVDDPVVASIRDNFSEQDLGADLRFETMLPNEAAELLKLDEVDVVIAGVKHDTATTVRAAIEHLRLPDTKITSFFVMEKDGEEPLFFADCAVHEFPTPIELVHIAEQTAQSVKHLGHEPVVAFLSLSTFGSADHLQSVQKIQQATDKFKERNPQIVAYGEIQVDAAINPRIFEKKARDKGVELVDGKMPNVFIFPDGISGNLSYKWLEQKAGYNAIGPFLDGTSKDMHDASRGATTEALVRYAELAAQLWRARHMVESDEQA